MTPNILAAATAESVLAAALAYAEMGFSVLPLHGKKPPILSNGLPLAWAERMVKRAPFSMIHGWQARGLLQNVGIVCGRVSDNLVVIDLDGENAVSEYIHTFPALLDTYSVATGSGKGAHFYYRCQQMPDTTRTKGYELRADGHYVVAPPSIHPDTHQAYLVGREVDILTLPDLNAVQRWIKAKLPSPSVRPERPKGQRIMGGRWATAALFYETRDVRTAKEGNRNTRLSIAAYNLGQIVGDNFLSRGDVERELLAAALAAGLDENEAAKTIKSGLDMGISEPRSLQWRKRGDQRGYPS